MSDARLHAEMHAVPHPSTMEQLPRASLSVGRTWHRRLRPVDRSFAYPVLFVWIPMRAWQDDSVHTAPGLARNRWGWLSWHDRDHGQGNTDALMWMEGLLRSEGIVADGEIWLQTLPRVLGFAFKPVSFWYAHRANGELAAVVAEVNNTFGERHCYLLPQPQGTPGATEHYRLHAKAGKVFHVSPFCSVDGHYEFAFSGQGDLRMARVDLHDNHGALMQTALSGRLHPLSVAAARRVVLRAPWAALAVVLRIHWQAIKLLWARVPFHRQPAAPNQFVTR